MKEETIRTLAYYEGAAEKFAEETGEAEFSCLQDSFAAMLPAGGRILDLGCGAGRDSRAFLKKGFLVTSVDGSRRLCRLAERRTGQAVFCTTFEAYEPLGRLDGIWACASLLHLVPEDIKKTVRRTAAHLKTGGIFYLSFKYGTFRGYRGERYFTDLTEKGLKEIFTGLTELTLIKTEVTEDVRPARAGELWLNGFFRKKGKETCL